MEAGERRFRSEDGREWTVVLESLGELLGVAPDLTNAGAMLPEESVRIVFRSGEETVSEEYTALKDVDDLSEEELRDWLEAALRGKGL